jgi:hypothetical protein
MQDAPNASELLEAVADFLNDELLPLTAENPRLRFHSLIAINVLNIVMRELNESEPLMRAEWQRLTELLAQPAREIPEHPQQLRREITDFNRELCARLRAAPPDLDATAWHAQLTQHLHATTREKLQIANPRFLERENQL